MGLKVSFRYLTGMLCFGCSCGVLVVSYSSKLSDSKFLVNYTSKEIIYLKEVYAICNPKMPRNPSKWSYVPEQYDSALQIRVVWM